MSLVASKYTFPQKVFVYWDYENVPLPKKFKFNVIFGVINKVLLNKIGRCIGINGKVYAAQKHAIGKKKRDVLGVNGYTHVQVPDNKPEGADKRMLVDISLDVLDWTERHVSNVIVLISGDKDFGYLLADLQHRRAVWCLGILLLNDQQIYDKSLENVCDWLIKLNALEMNVLHHTNISKQFQIEFGGYNNSNVRNNSMNVGGYNDNNNNNAINNSINHRYFNHSNNNNSNANNNSVTNHYINNNHQIYNSYKTALVKNLNNNNNNNNKNRNNNALVGGNKQKTGKNINHNKKAFVAGNKEKNDKYINHVYNNNNNRNEKAFVGGSKEKNDKYIKRVYNTNNNNRNKNALVGGKKETIVQNIINNNNSSNYQMNVGVHKTKVKRRIGSNYVNLYHKTHGNNKLNDVGNKLNDVGNKLNDVANKLNDVSCIPRFVWHNDVRGYFCENEFCQLWNAVKKQNNFCKYCGKPHCV